MPIQPIHPPKIKIGDIEMKAGNFQLQIVPPPPPSSEEIEQLKQAFARIGQAAQEVATVLTTAVSEALESFEDAMRSNAYRPDGPVVRSTAEVLPLDEASE